MKFGTRPPKIQYCDFKLEIWIDRPYWQIADKYFASQNCQKLLLNANPNLCIHILEAMFLNFVLTWESCFQKTEWFHKSNPSFDWTEKGNCKRFVIISFPNDSDFNNKHLLKEFFKNNLTLALFFSHLRRMQKEAA